VPPSLRPLSTFQEAPPAIDSTESIAVLRRQTAGPLYCRHDRPVRAGPRHQTFRVVATATPGGSPKTSEPSRIHIANQISQMIRSGEHERGHALPRERDLADAFSVSRLTLREAMSALQHVRVIETRAGLGSFVGHVFPGIPVASCGRLVQPKALARFFR